MINMLLIDMDDVIADLQQEWIRRYNKDYNDNLDYRKIDLWNIEKHIRPECGSKIRDYFKEPTFYFNLKPIDGAIEGIYKIMNILDINKIRICTYCLWDAVYGFSEKIMWIEKHIPELRDKVIIAKDKYLLARHDRILIDDAPHNLNEFSQFNGTSIVFDKSYNKELPYLRAYDWEHIFNLIKRINSELEFRLREPKIFNSF